MKRHHLFIALLLAAFTLSACATRKRGKGKGCDCPGFGVVTPDSTVRSENTPFRV